MSILEKLFSRKIGGGAAEAGDTATVRRIVRRLESLDPDQARFVAAFSYILGRVAHADRQISEEETRVMEEIVLRMGHLPEDQAVLVVQIAKSQNQLFGGTENFLVTREFRDLATREQRQDLLDCLFAVSAADDSISTVEENQIRQISSELGFSHREYVATRRKYSDQREVMRSFRESREK